MECCHFNACGSCALGSMGYEAQLAHKHEAIKELLGEYCDSMELFKSQEEQFRARAEFRIWHEGDRIFYAMTNRDKNGTITISQCPMVAKPIAQRMWRLLELLESNELLRHKLFGVEFLSTQRDELLVTLLYHKRLDSSWEQEASKLQELLNIYIIGRSRKQRVVLSQEYVMQTITVGQKQYHYKQYETGFTQPNTGVNAQMIGWAKAIAIEYCSGDFLEAYCGLGNFTIPLSEHFERCFATEISKHSIYSAKENMELNGVDNIEFARLSAAEMTQALRAERSFRRLEGISLDSYNFETILVDPPRAGLDEDSLQLAASMKHIIYISCNPQTLQRDLKQLTQTHKVVKMALFDQFAYSNHIECGLYLQKLS